MNTKNILRAVFITWAVIAVGLITQSSAASELDDFIQSRMDKAKIPGLAVCIVKNGEIQWTKGYGWADVDKKIAVTPSTLFWVASISKTVTATALMQLHEERRFRLDDDVNQYLPFSVRNPNHPNAPITFRQLLTHTSGIPFRKVPVDANSFPLGIFLQHFFVPGGRYYLEENFYASKPGQSWYYSNIAYALIGFLVEQISGLPFDQYCKKEIFKPLKMRETSWFYGQLDPAHLAKPYRYDSTSQTYLSVKTHPYMPGYPAGQLRTSVRQLARFLIAQIQQGRYKGIRILKQKTAGEMRRVQFPEIAEWQGLSFFLSSDGSGSYIGHGGGGPGEGVRTAMVFRVENGTGIIMLANRYTDNQAWYEIRQRLFAHADQY